MLHVQSPWFEEIVAGRKIIEGRSGTYEEFSKYLGQDIIITNGIRTIRVTITHVEHFDSLREYLEKYWKEAASHTSSFEDAYDAYINVKKPDGSLVFREERVKQRGGINALFIKI